MYLKIVGFAGRYQFAYQGGSVSEVHILIHQSVHYQ